MTGFRKDQKFIQSVTFSKIVRENLNFQKMFRLGGEIDQSRPIADLDGF